MRSDTDSKYIAVTRRKARNEGKTVWLVDNAEVVFFYCADGELSESGVEQALASRRPAKAEWQRGNARFQSRRHAYRRFLDVLGCSSR